MIWQISNLLSSLSVRLPYVVLWGVMFSPCLIVCPVVSCQHRLVHRAGQVSPLHKCCCGGIIWPRTVLCCVVLCFLLLVQVWLLVPLQLIAWIVSSPKWPVMYQMVMILLDQVVEACCSTDSIICVTGFKKEASHCIHCWPECSTWKTDGSRRSHYFRRKGRSEGENWFSEECWCRGHHVASTSWLYYS